MSENKKAAVKDASENKKQAVKEETRKNDSKATKILNWFKTLPARIAKPFKNMYYELKKVTWPSKKKLISYSIIVLMFMLFMGVVIGLLDLGASTGVRLLIPAAETTSTVAADEIADLSEEAADEVTAEENAVPTEGQESGETGDESSNDSNAPAEDAGSEEKNDASAAGQNVEQAADQTEESGANEPVNEDKND